ncbi:MAG: transporter substrate-binding domain-containing protein [Lachnospiraceae bacterium]|nr:transporter substrate-binding domain-containing protein [Lachnospiraceae bacterium]
MKYRNIRILTAITLITAMAALASGCGSDAKAATAGAEDGDAQTITIGCNISVAGQNDYLDDDDHLTGSTVELMRQVDELLPEYRFELVPTSFDDVFVGLESGSYQGGEANCFLTQERIEKYAIPKENICASYIGLLVKKDLGDLKSFEDVAKRQKEEGLTFYPMQAGNGLTYPVEVYNEENPDNQIVFEYSSENTNNDVQGWIANGRYDVGLALYATWVNNFEDEEGAYHEYVDDLTWIPIQNVGVYNLFDKDAVSQEFLDKYDAALKQLKDDGKASEISKEFFGYDVFDNDINNLTEKK